MNENDTREHPCDERPRDERPHNELPYVPKHMGKRLDEPDEEAMPQEPVGAAPAGDTPICGAPAGDIPARGIPAGSISACEGPADAGSAAHRTPAPRRRRKRPRRSFRKHVLRAITGNFARFMAVFGIVAIGAGVYAGLRAFVPDMYVSADAYYDQQNFADLQINAGLGLTEEDVEAVAAVEGVRGATGIATYEVAMTSGEGRTFEVQLEALDMADYRDALGAADGTQGNQRAVSRMDVIEGRLPETPDEIAVSTNGGLKDDELAVGDTLSAEEVVGADAAGDTLAETTFTVVGLVQSPEWLSNSTGLSPTSGARITNYAYVDLAAMADPDLYTGIIATTDAGIGETSFTDAYDDAVAPVRDAVKELAPEREQARYNELTAEIDSARAELQSALQTANDAQAQAQAGIDQANAALAQYQPVVDELGAYDEATLASLGQLENLAAARSATDQANAALAAAQDGLVQAQDAAAQAQEALDELEETAAELEPQHWYVLTRSANPSYYLYQSTALRMERICLIFPIFFFLVAALVSLTTMSRMVETDRVEIGTLKALGYQKGTIARKYLAFSGLASALGAVLGVCAGVFTLPLAIWIPYSRVYIGFDFIMGFHQPDCAIAVALSVALALAATWAAVRRTLRETAASLLLPAAPKTGRRIVLERLKPLWRRLSFSQKVTARNIFRYKKRMVMTIVGVAGCTGLVLTGFGVQDKLDGFVQAQYGGVYTYEVVANFDPALDEAAGAGEGAASSQLAGVLDGQLGEGAWEYFVKQSAVAENPAGDAGKIAFGIGGNFDKTGGSVQAEMRAGRSDYEGDPAEGILRDVFIYVPQNGSDQDLVRIDDYRTGERLVLPGQGLQGTDGSAGTDAGGTGAGADPDAGGADTTAPAAGDASAGSATVTAADGRELPGAVITERLAEQLLVGVGDVIELAFTSEDEPVEVCVSGIMHNYVGHYVYLSPAAYELAFGEKPSYNMVLGMNERGADPSELTAAIAEQGDAVTSASLPSDESGGYDDIAESLNSIVLIILVVSGMLAFIVIYALTEINVEERKREIATLKVLGFMRREVRGYVYRETYLLVGIGILCGLPFGVWLCDFIMRAAEFDNVIFFRTIDAPCYLYAVLFTAVVAIVVTFAMRKRLYGIDMVSSLKSVD